MAEKVLNTRIVLKNDTLANWGESTLVLKKGELALAHDSEGKVYGKVGDGSKTWSALPYAFRNYYLSTDNEVSHIVNNLKAYVDEKGAALDGDVEALSAAIDYLSGQIDAEVSARGDADDFLSGKIDTANADIGYLSGRFDAEASARGAADNYLSGAIDAEVSARGAADDYLSGQIDAEVSARGAADDYLSAQIQTKQDIVVWNTAYDPESNKAATMQDIASLNGAMHFRGVEAALPSGDDLSAYENGDVIIVDKKEYVLLDSSGTKTWNEFGDEEAYITVDEDLKSAANIKTHVANAVSAEADLRSAADSYLSGAVDAEVSARGAADDYLSGQIDAEVSARGDADTYLSGQIDAEVSARGAADDYLSGQIDTEVSAREAADDYLSGRIDALGAGFLSAVSLNGLDFAIANNAASLTVDVIDCGGAA